MVKNIVAAIEELSVQRTHRSLYIGNSRIGQYREQRYRSVQSWETLNGTPSA